MKKVTILVCFLLSLLSINAFSQNQSQPQGQRSRLESILSLYKLTNAQKATLDSILNPLSRSIVDIKQTPELRVTIPDSLLIVQVTMPIEAKILTDTFGGYNEVVSYRTITTVVSEKHEKGSFKDYQVKFKEFKRRKADEMRVEADRIRDAAAKMEKDE